MALDQRTLQKINYSLVIASGIVAFGGLFYFVRGSLWWWTCIADLVLFGYKLAAKFDLALMDRPRYALPPLSRGDWEDWFAWYPVQVDVGKPAGRFRLPGDWVFLCAIKRRWATGETGADFETHYAYRQAPSTHPEHELV
jgi:hypothetical protein